MATKQLKASYVLDADGVRKGVQQADQHLSGLEGALKRTRAVGVGAFGAFSGVLREVGGEVAGPLMASVGGLGEAFGGVAERVEKLGESGSKLQKLGAATAGIGAAAAGVGIGLEALGSPMEEARKQLEASVTAAGGSFDELKGKVGGVEGTMERLGHRSTDTDQALSTLTAGLQDPAKAMGEMGLAANIAAARHVSLSAAADMLVKAHAGSTRVFKQFGIDVKTNADGTKDLDTAFRQLNERLKGQAEASVDSFGGHLRVLKAEVLDGAAALGAKYGPAITAAGAGVSLLGGVMDGAGAIIRHFTTATEVATAATEGMEVAETGMGVASGIALGPILLIIAAIALIAVGVYELIKHWGAVKDFFIGLWGDVKGIFFDAWHAIHDALADAWGGLEKWFKDLPGNILDAIKDIGSWLYQKGLDLIAGLIAGQINAAAAFMQWYVELPGNILNLLVDAAHWLQDAGGRILHGLADGVVAAAPVLWNFYVSLPGRILGFLIDAGHWLQDAGVRVLHGLIDGAESATGALWDWLKGLPGRIIDTALKIANIQARMMEIGWNIIHGIIHGIENAAGDLWGAAKKVVDDLINAVASKLKLRSPSKVFADMGRYTMEGLRDGITANAHLPMGALGRVADGLGQFSLALPGAAVAAGGSTRPFSGAAAGPAVINFTLNVAGHVTTERDLGDFFHEFLLSKQQRQPLGFTS